MFAILAHQVPSEKMSTLKETYLLPKGVCGGGGGGGARGGGEGKLCPSRNDRVASPECFLILLNSFGAKIQTTFVVCFLLFFFVFFCFVFFFVFFIFFFFFFFFFFFNKLNVKQRRSR